MVGGRREARISDYFGLDSEVPTVEQRYGSKHRSVLPFSAESRAEQEPSPVFAGSCTNEYLPGSRGGDWRIFSSVC